MPTPPPLSPLPSPSSSSSPSATLTWSGDDATWTDQAQQQLSRRRSQNTTPLPFMTSFTTFDDALRSLSISSSSSALALDTARASLEQASPAPGLSATPRQPFYPDSYSSVNYQRRRQLGSRRPSSIDPHARLDGGGGHGEDDAERVLPLRAAGSGHLVRPSRPQQCQHQLTAPALLQTQRLPNSKSEGGEAEAEEQGGVLKEEVETQEEAQVMTASPQPQQPTAHHDTKVDHGEDVVPNRTALKEQRQAEGGQQLDYCHVVASSDHGSRPSYATLTFSSFSSSSSGSSSSTASSTASSSATNSSSDSSSTVTAGTGFSTTPGAASAGVGRRASAPATPTLSSSSSWSSFCPLLARLPSYDEENPQPLESPGAAPDMPGPMHLQLPGSGGVGSRRPYNPSPLTPFPHHSSYFRPSLPASASSSSMRSPSPYARVPRRASAMSASYSPASSSRGRDYMNPDTPPRTPPAAAALMMAALERRRSESAAVMTRKGLGSGSCSPVSGTRRLTPQCASCGRCKPEKSRYCCGWPPVHMVLFHGPSGRGWADEGKEKSSRASRRSRVVTGGMR